MRKLEDKGRKINVNFVINGQTELDFTKSETARIEALAAINGKDEYKNTLPRLKRMVNLLERRFEAKTFAELSQ